MTLIASKREVAAHCAGFPWSECQVRKLATSHCTKHKSTEEWKHRVKVVDKNDTHGKVVRSPLVVLK